MELIVILFFFGIYLLITITVITITTVWASRKQRRPWLWGSLAAVVMYNLVFWDLVPTLVMHKYYCDTQAGFWVYKTPEQWKAENPGVVETLKESLRSTSDSHNWLNQRFYTEVNQNNNFAHAIGKTEKKLFDVKDNKLIALYIDFWRGKSGGVFGLGGTPDDLRQALVLGWGNRNCVDEGNPPNDKFNKFSYQFWEWGQNK